MTSNPVLLNDLRRSIFRRKPVLAVAMAAAAILVLTVIAAAFSPPSASLSRQDQMITRFPDLLLPLVAPMFTAGAFAKEHELRTWQDLLITRLTNSQLLFGKLWAGFIPTCVALLVLAPPFALILVAQGREWAMEPGLWMVALGAKFLIVALFYASLGLVCSFHSPNARVALAVTYCALAGYGMLNYLAWTYMTPYYEDSSSNYQSYNVLEMSGRSGDRMEPFTLGALDLVVMFQSMFLGFWLLVYLYCRVRRREA